MEAPWEFLKKSNGHTEPTVLQPDETENVRVIKDLKTHGFQQASECKAALAVLKSNISKLYYNKIIDDEEFFNKEEERKNDLRKQLHDEEGNFEKCQMEITNLNQKRLDIEKEIGDLRAKKEKINAGDKAILGEMQPPDRIGYNVGLFILLFLTAYLFLFYTSAIYNAFVYDVKEATKESIFNNSKITTTIFNPNAIVDAWNKSVFTFLFILTSPMIFLGLGYLIHKFNETKKYAYTALILVFTFFFDAIIAYAIVSEIHEGKYMTAQGGVDKPWQFDMIYSSVPFYIILAAGFVIYIVWGVVLSFVISGHNQLNPIRSALRTITNEINALKEKLIEFNGNLSELNDRKSAIQANVKKIESDLSLEKFNKKNFEHRVADFMSGWHNWITQGLPYEKHVRQTDAENTKEQIIQTLYQLNLTKNVNNQ